MCLIYTSLSLFCLEFFGVAAVIEWLMGLVQQLHSTYGSAYSDDIMMAAEYAAYEGSPKITDMSWPHCKACEVCNCMGGTIWAL